MHKTIHKSSNIEVIKKITSPYYLQLPFLLESVFKLQSIGLCLQTIIEKQASFQNYVKLAEPRLIVVLKT